MGVPAPTGEYVPPVTCADGIAGLFGFPVERADIEYGTVGGVPPCTPGVVWWVALETEFPADECCAGDSEVNAEPGCGILGWGPTGSVGLLFDGTVGCGGSEAGLCPEDIDWPMLELARLFVWGRGPLATALVTGCWSW